MLLLGEIACSRGKCLIRATESGQNLTRMFWLEEIHGGDVSVWNQVDFEVPRKPGCRHPEVVAHQAEHLDFFAVALPQRGQQLVALIVSTTEKPLLELVEHHEHLAALAEIISATQCQERIDQSGALGQPRNRLLDSPQEPSHCFTRRRLEIDRRDMFSQARQEPRLDQRRFTAPGRTINHPHTKRLVRVSRLDPRLPKPQSVRQPLSVARTGQQFEEEVGVVLVERAESLGNDPQRPGGSIPTAPGGG